MATAKFKNEKDGNNEGTLTYLHSHSGLERELRMEKHNVLVDAHFKYLFEDVKTIPVKKYGIQYIKVPTQLFWKRGGVFKNLFH